ncbi:alpha-1,2-mannosyltransferase [Nitrobacteraceae bacterium AZCC 1564]
MTASRIMAAVRSGAWLTHERIIGYSIILLAYEGIAFIYFVALANGLIDATLAASGTDFTSFYAAGRLAQQGTPELAYDQAAHHAMERIVVGGPTAYNFFYYPPVFLLLCSLLANLPYTTALFLFEATTLAAFLWVGRRILADRKPITVLALLAFPPIWYNALLGQNAFLTASLFGLGFLLLERRPILAGIVLGAICYKPHYGLLLPVAFVASRNAKAFIAAAGSVATLITLSLLQFGWATWAAYLEAAAGSHASYESGAVDMVSVATPFGASLVLGLPSSQAYIVQGVVTACVVAWVGIVWHRGDMSLALRFASLLAAIPLTVPIFQYYDLAILVFAFAWLTQVPRARGIMPFERTAIACLYVASIFTYYTNATPRLLVAPMVAAGIFLITVARVRFERSFASLPATGNPPETATVLPGSLQVGPSVAVETPLR